MTKNINGDLYSDLITSADNRAMAAGSIPRAKIDRIIIHHNATTNKNVAINTWLASGAAQTSAHYEVADNEIIGIVGEGTTAWHSGDYYMNARSIGIEHKNATGAPTWTISEATYVSSAKLVADIAKRYGFAPDATHVIPHSQVHPTACPGGIDMNKLRSMSMKIYNGGSVPSNTGYNSSSSNNVDQVLNVGDHFKAPKAIRVDELKKVNGYWQVINYDLVGGKDFNWVNNGLGVVSVDRVDSKGNKIINQTLHVGSYFRLHSDRVPVIANDPKTNGVAFNTRLGKVWVSANKLTEVK